MLVTGIALALVMPSVAVDDEILFPGTGDHKRQVITTSARAKEFFDQGLNWLYAFNHEEAQRSFEAATRHDPSFAMAWWGVAMSHGPHINYPLLEPERAKVATEAIQKARSLMSGESAANRALIEATTNRYKYPQPEDRSGLDRAFANAMRATWRNHPNDDDIGAMFAESMMNLRPWDLWKPNGTPQPGTNEIVRTLEQVMRVNPSNPLANHLYIHAVEASPNPEKALEAADRLLNLQPGLGHNVHMPSHIYVRVGQWQKAIESNARAMIVDRDFRAKRQQVGIYRIYMAHNNHMLTFAAMMNGQSVLAMEAIDQMVADIPEDAKVEMAPFIDGFMAMPIEVRKRFGRWQEILDMPNYPEHFPLSRAMRHAARSVAHAAMHNPSKARQEQYLFYEAKKAIPDNQTFGNNMAKDLVVVAEHLMNGEILVAENKPDRAVAELQRAISAEDKLRYSEPPDWIQPARHTLGAYLVKLGRYREAERVYRDDLKKLPNNGWALYGLAVALEKTGRASEAAQIRAKFSDTWTKADVNITSSCMCIPGN